MLSPARPQDPTFTVYLLLLPDLCPTYSLKLGFAAYLFTQAKGPTGIPSPDGN